MCRWVLVLTALVLAGCGTHSQPSAPVVYGYAWTEQQQQEAHDFCVADVIKRAPKDSSAADLQRYLFMCLDKTYGMAF